VDVTTQETVTHTTQDIKSSVDPIVSAPPTYSDNITEDLWYKRPVKVGIVNITSSAVVDTSFNFITTWLADPLVNRKLRNVRLIRPIFRVRVHINSNPTVYGPIMVIPAYNGTKAQTTFGNGRSVDSAIISSCGVNEAEFTIPWTYPYDYFTLNNGGGTINLTFDEPAASGTKNGQLTELRLISPIALRTVSAAFPGVAIVVTVWCESLETAQIYQPQSGGNDEYSRPNVSKTATALANEIDKVNVPILKPFTTATSLALRVGSGLASIFGYSRPMNIETQIPYVNVKYGDSFSLNSTRTGRRLVEDIKQEVSLNDFSSGPSETIDELSFDALCSKWTTVFATDLAMGSTPGAFLSFPVTPCIASGIATGVWDMTTLGVCAFNFLWWRGDMHYKIRVDSTVYHSGVLQILWTPQISNTNIDGTNVTEQFLFDINGTKEVDFVVPYSYTQPYLKTKMYQVGSSRAQWSNGGETFYNGRIEINYWTPIAGANNVYIQIWAKGENMDFDTQSNFADMARYNNFSAPDSTGAIPTQPITPVVQIVSSITGQDSNYTPQSGNDPTPVPPGETSLQGSASVAIPTTIYLGPKKSIDYTNQIVTGQKFRSLRPYLKRNMPFIRWTTQNVDTTPLSVVRIGIDLPGAILPPSRYGSAGQLTNYVEGNMLNILSTAFMGWKGAIRYHVSPTGIDEATVMYNNNSVSTANSLQLPACSSFASESILTELRGQFSSRNHGIQHFGREEEISFEIPYRFKQNWVATCRRGVGNTFGPVPIDTAYLPQATIVYSTIGTNKIMVDTSIGEDFNYFIRTVMNPIVLRTNTIRTTKVAPIAYAGIPPPQPALLAPPKLMRTSIADGDHDNDDDILEQSEAITELRATATSYVPQASEDHDEMTPEELSM